ncbi:hypothetical protein TNCV_1721271, partial [Trichonephila clavipes]
MSATDRLGLKTDYPLHLWQSALELPFQVVNMDLIGPIDPPSPRDINIFYVWLISTL